MNIVLINFDDIVGSFGGVSKVFADMSNSLSSMGNTVTALTFEVAQGEPAYPFNSKVNLRNCCQGLFEKVFHNDGIAKLKTFYIRDREKRRTKRYRIELTNKSRAIKKALDDTNPDVIVAFQQEVTYLLMEILKIKTPVVTMLHNEPSFYFDRPEFKIFKPALNKCAFVQVLIPQYVEQAKRYLEKDNVIYIPNVVPQYKDVPKLTNPVILNVAKISSRKRQHLIVEAFAKIADKHPLWSVDLWGWNQGEYGTKLRNEIKRLGLESKVRLCGETQKIAEKYKEASIFAFPSVYEGFSLALTEAMSAGLPVIGCKDCLSVSSMIEHGVNGLMCDSNSDDLAKQLDILMSDHELRVKLGQEAKKSVQKYAPSVVWQQWDDLLKSLSEKSSPK